MAQPSWDQVRKVSRSSAALIYNFGESVLSGLVPHPKKGLSELTLLPLDKEGPSDGPGTGDSAAIITYTALSEATIPTHMRSWNTAAADRVSSGTRRW